MINNSLPQQFANLPLMPGDIKYKDIPNALGGTDNAINEYDKVALGYPVYRELYMVSALPLNTKIWTSLYSFREPDAYH